MTDKERQPYFVMGRAIPAPDGGMTVQPLGLQRRCAVNNCRRQAAGLFEWDKDIKVTLCQKHADHFKLQAVDG